MAEISYDEARAQEVRTVIAEFPEIKYLSGPENVAPNDVWRIRYRCENIMTGAALELTDKRWDGTEGMRYSIRLQIKARLLAANREPYKDLS